MVESRTPATVLEPREAPAKEPVPALLAVAMAVAAGLAMAGQSAANGALAGRLGSPLSAAMVSNVLGGVLLFAIVAAFPDVRRGLRRIRADRRPWWVYIGGAFGALFLFTGALAVPLIGVALFTVGQVCGQTGGGLLADRLGLGPNGRVRVTGWRVLGTVLAVAAVVTAQFGHGLKSDAAWWLLPFVAVIGVGLAGQSAFNGRVTQISRQPFATGVVNFLVGTGVLVVVFVPLRIAGSVPWNGLPSEPWLYAGGLVGPFVVALVVTAVASIGVLRSGLATLAGQLGGALALDVARTHAAPSPWVVAGVAITAVAVFVSGRGNKPLGDARARPSTAGRWTAAPRRRIA